jgi:hypothetical protein
MPRLMLHGPRLRGYAPYARGLRSGPTEWIILWMAGKRKLTNQLSYLEHRINFHIIYYPLYMLIMQVCLDSGRIRNFGHMVDSGHMRDFDCKPDSGRKIWLQSYIPTPVTLPDSGQHHDFGRLSWPQLRIMTPVNECVACLTTSAVKDFAWMS